MELSKGGARAIMIWLFFIVIVFVIILGYTTMSRVYTSGMWEDIENISEFSESTDATTVSTMNKGVWQYFPYIALLAFLLWALFASGGGA